MLGQVVMGYRIVREIGRGGMGSVYEAVHEGIGQRAAVKFLSSGFIDQPKYAERFVTEARATAAVRHPGLVTIFHSDRLPDGTPYILMEYLCGESMDSRIVAYKHRNKPIPTAFVLEIVRHVAAAIDAVHQHGIVHRDLKPANLFLVADSDTPFGERVKVLDFGIAKVTRKVDDGVNLQTTIGNFVGTAVYASPEQCRMMGEIGPAADVYSLGVIMYEMLAGVPPFAATHPGVIISMHLFQEVPNIRKYRQDISEAICVLLDQLLTKEPDRRPSMEQVVVAIDRIKKENEYLSEGAVAIDAPGQKLILNRTQKDRLRRELFRRIGPWFVALFTMVALLAVYGNRQTPQAAPPRRPQLLHEALVPVDLSTPPDAQYPVTDGHAMSLRGIAHPLDGAAASPLLASTDGEIRVGMTAGFNGPVRGLALHMKHGMLSYFESVNEEGGIYGRKIRLIASDDRYMPAQARQSVQRLVEDDHVVALVGSVGTGTTEAFLPDLQKYKLLLLGPYTGTDNLRPEPPERYVFHLRASYQDETAELTSYLIEVQHVSPKRIAVFYQNDGYGYSGLRGVQRALRKRGYFQEPLKTSYERHADDISHAVDEVVAQREQIGAIIMICTARTCAKFIKAVKDKGMKSWLGTISGAGDLAAELGQIGASYGRGVLVTQVVPPSDGGSELAARYRKHLQRYFPEEQPSFMSLEGYLVAALFTKAAQRAAATPLHQITSETLIAALESIENLDLGVATTISYGPNQHQGLRRVWGMVLDGNAQLQRLPDFDR